VKVLKTKSPQPANREGGKSIDCPFYADCLMHAAKRNWKAWTCEECPNLELSSVCQKLKYIAPYYQLLADIYPEFRRKYESAMDSSTPEP
jgi:hypothetical protein